MNFADSYSACDRHTYHCTKNVHVQFNIDVRHHTSKSVREHVVNNVSDRVNNFETARFSALQEVHDIFDIFSISITEML
jgi:hypothetical protein